MKKKKNTVVVVTGSGRRLRNLSKRNSSDKGESLTSGSISRRQTKTEDYGGMESILKKTDRTFKKFNEEVIQVKTDLEIYGERK